VADRLFATLDSTTRRVALKGKGELLLSDTVGFIKKLPHDLIASFKSTLMEANTADMLLHVVDFSVSDIAEKITVVNKILADIGAGDLKRIIVFNKVDLVNSPNLRRSMLQLYPGCGFVSAKTGEGIESLRESLYDICSEMYAELEVKISEKDSQTITLISKLMQVFSSRLENGGMIFRGRILKIDIPKLEKNGAEVDIFS
jgi:GTP-binding protein HflX